MPGSLVVIMPGTSKARNPRGYEIEFDEESHTYKTVLSVLGTSTGAIPRAGNDPFPPLGKLADTLPKDAKCTVYYCSGTKLVGHFFPDIHFAAVYGQREGVAIKPDPTIVNDILRVTGITRTDTIYIGDSGVDMLTAHHAEVESIGVTWGFRDEEELRTHGAHHIVHQAKDILQFVE